MDDELRQLYQERLKEILEEIRHADPAEKEHEGLVKELAEISKVLNEDLKIQQGAWDAEEARKLDEDIRNKQVEADKFRSKLDLAKGLGGATITGLIGFAGLKRAYKWIYKMETEGIIPNREAIKWIPKLKFW